MKERKRRGGKKGKKERRIATLPHGNLEKKDCFVATWQRAISLLIYVQITQSSILVSKPTRTFIEALKMQHLNPNLNLSLKNYEKR